MVNIIDSIQGVNMIDLQTGRFEWGPGYALWPGMTRADFQAGALYENELPQAVKEEPEKYICALKTQVIDGFEMSIDLFFDQDGYLDRIEMSRPDFYTWPDWPKDRSESEIHKEIKLHNDRFLATQMGGQIEGGRELSFDYDWGTISSTFSCVHDPDAEIIIRYRTWRITGAYPDDGRPIFEILDEIDRNQNAR